MGDFRIKEAAKVVERERAGEPGMSKAIDELLESVAKELYDRSVDFPPIEILPDVLKRRLSPLLEAGQAMRKSRVNISDDAMAWDAALAAGKGRA